jgi:hypothetical protein
MYRHHSALPKRPHRLFFKDRFNLADLLLDLASELFTAASRLRVQIFDDLTGDLFYFPLAS